MFSPKQVSLHLVTWNSKKFLPALFASMEVQTYKDFSSIVVDNASHDGTREWIVEKQPDTCILRNIRNLGFARAHNQAISMALQHWNPTDYARKYIFVVNPDIELDITCIQQLVATMESDMQLAAIGPTLLRAIVSRDTEGEREVERTQIIDSAGLVMSKKRQAYDRGAGEKNDNQYYHARDVFGLSGACVLFRASALVAAAIDIGYGPEYFDPDFFAYKEDVDLAWRMKKFGMRAQCNPNAIAWHHRGTPSAPQANILQIVVARYKKPAHVNRFSTRNQFWLVWKNDEIMNRLRDIFWVVPYEVGLFFSACISWSSCVGVYQALGGAVRMYKKRYVISKKTIVFRKEIRKWFI